MNLRVQPASMETPEGSVSSKLSACAGPTRKLVHLCSLLRLGPSEIVAGELEIGLDA
jgi:hypothetical protein